MNKQLLIQQPLELVSALPSWNVHNANVLLRLDLNVTLVNGMVTDYNDSKLQAALPTINFLLSQQPQHLILLTHIGNPKHADQSLSTEKLIPWFLQHGYKPYFAETIEQLHQLLITPATSQLLLFENLRFFPEEKQRSLIFAQQLAQHCTFYVNDAFGTVHRHDTSMTLLPEQFNQHNRTIGFLIEHELKALNALLHRPKRPLLLFLGGKKVSDKIQILERILPSLDGIFLLPALVFTFLESQGQLVGSSLIDQNSVALCKMIIAKAQQLQIPIYVPEDYYVENNGQFYEQPSTVFGKDNKGICVGSQTITRWKKYINAAGTIISNGAQGFIERPETLVGAKLLYEAFTHASAKTIIAGGDSIAMVNYLIPYSNHLICSTGGGATLAYLAGMPLPGLDLFKK